MYLLKNTKLYCLDLVLYASIWTRRGMILLLLLLLLCIPDQRTRRFRDRLYWGGRALIIPLVINHGEKKEEKKWKRHNKPPPYLHHNPAKHRPATCSIRGGKLALQTISILPGNLWKANIHAKRWRRRSRNTYYYIYICVYGAEAVYALNGVAYIYIYIYMFIIYWSSTCPFAECGARWSLLNLCRVYWLSERTAAVQRTLPNIKTAQKEAARNALAGDDCVRFILVSGPQIHVQ